MLAIRLVVEPVEFDALALPVRPARGAGTGAAAAGAGAAGAAGGEPVGTVPPTSLSVPDDLLAEATTLLPQVEHTGGPGLTYLSIRPAGSPERLLLIGVGAGDEAGWRAAGAALARAGAGERPITVAMPVDAGPEAVRGLAEGLWLASYRFRMPDQRDGATGDADLAEVLLAVADAAPHEAALAAARTVAEWTRFARDLTNTPANVKSPAWFADQVSAAAADRAGVSVRVREPEQLAAEGFGGILAVSSGSARGPRLVEVAWRPVAAAPHVVLIGKGITFDTGGISIKPREAMKLMRKDMGGAAAVVAATLGAAALRLPVRVTALAPLAENMIGGGAFRPGDVVRHYGGMTSESTNSDAEGRLVLADALAYAVDRLAPDLLVDLATLTGANAVALGKRTGAVYSDSDELAAAVVAAAAEAGELAWRMPLPGDYVEYLGSDLADFYSAPVGGPGSVVAALYLREFTGELRDRWLHVDMSAPSWADANDGELVKGATGWGVRSLLRWLATLEADPRWVSRA